MIPGPRMLQALAILEARDGWVPSKLFLAERIGPNGSRKFGYLTVARLLKHGLVRIDPDHPGRSRTGSGAVVLVRCPD